MQFGIGLAKFHAIRQYSCRNVQTASQPLEVDFLVGDEIGVEVKSKARVSPRDYRGLNALGEEVRLKRKLVICGEKMRRKADDGAEIMPPALFLKELWAGKLVD